MRAPAPLQQVVYNPASCQPNFDATSPLCPRWIGLESAPLNVALSPSLALSAAAALGVRRTRFFARCAAFPSVMAVSLTMPAGLSSGRAELRRKGAGA